MSIRNEILTEILSEIQAGTGNTMPVAPDDTNVHGATNENEWVRIPAAAVISLDLTLDGTESATNAVLQADSDQDLILPDSDVDPIVVGYFLNLTNSSVKSAVEWVIKTQGSDLINGAVEFRIAIGENWIVELTSANTYTATNAALQTQTVRSVVSDDDIFLIKDETTKEAFEIPASDVASSLNQTDPEIKTQYESNANTNAFTDPEKSKLAGLESSKFLGEYVSLSALQSAHPSPAVGSYGYVDTGVGQDVQQYIWDYDDNNYVLQLGESTAETPASVKSKYESNLDTNAFTDSEKSKLGGVEAGAEVNQPDTEIKTQYEANANTNAFTDTEKSKLGGIEAGAEANQSDSEIKTQYEANVNTNAFTDAEKTNLGNQSGTNSGDENTSSIQSKRPLKTVNGETLEGVGDVVTPDTTYTDAEIKTKYEANADTNAYTDAEKTNLGNQSGTNTGDQDLSGKQDVLAEGPFVDGDKTKLDSQSGVNTGDQDLSGLALKSNVLELDNTDPFTPDADYEPATKKYVDDNEVGLGYSLATWGGNLQNIGKHPSINGAANAPEISSLGIEASAPVPSAGTIDTITYYNTTGDNTTEFKIIKNGVVMHTFTCVGPYGVETGINIPTGFVGSVADNIAIRYASGTAPGEGFYSMYIK